MLGLKERHTKMEKLYYSVLKHSALFKENMKNSFLQSTACPFCFVQPDNQTHSVQCTVVISKTKVEGNYEDIFKENIPTVISKTLLRISKLREGILQS